MAAAALLTATLLGAYNIKGLVADPDGELLPSATVKLLHAKDSAFVKGVKTNTHGAFTISGISKGKYILQASYVGFSDTYRNLDLKKSVDLDTIFLLEGGVNLQEVVVTGVRTEIKVMEDTVEYNAGSFKTQPNSVVEDLLKRLPGVEVGTDGKITANGKQVTKILVDGKEFFSDDPQVASKNLPVDMVDKLQVVDRKSDLARMTGVDDGEEETVINLTVKKGMKNGWFGNVEGGYGTMGRYSGNFNVNRFWNDNQVTFLGNFNNINRLGFSDGGGGRFRRFGGSNGINTSQAFGVNFNVGNKEIFRVGGNVMYSHTDQYSVSTRERQYLFTDSTAFANTFKRSEDRGHNFRADFRLQWNPDSFNSLEIRPRLSYNINDSESLDSTLNMAGNALRSAVSRAQNFGVSHGKSFEFGTRLIYNHKFRSKRGRSFSIDVNYSHSNVRENERSLARNIFYLLNDSVDFYDQLNNNHTWNDNISARVSWTEPLGDASRGFFLTIAYRLNYRWNNADKLVSDLPENPDFDMSSPLDLNVDASGAILNESLSNRFRNDYFNQDIRIGVRKVNKVMNLEAGVSLVPQRSKSIDLINSDRNVPQRSVFNFAPFVNYRHRFSKSRSLNFRYNGRSSQPSMTQLQPVPDMTDPMNIVIGNPDLKPSFSHNVNLRFQDFNMESQRSFMLMANASMTQNSIVSIMRRDHSTGAQTTNYTNVNGVWNAMLMNMVSFPFRNRNWQFNNHIFANYNHNVGFNNGERNNSGSFNISIGPALAFRPENLELEIRPRYSIQLTRNSLQTSSNRTVHNFGGTFNAYYRTPFDLILASDLTYTATRGYAEGYDKNEWMWNASISYQTLPDKSLTFSVRAYDLLRQRSNISRSITANYIDDQSYNSLTRYFMFSVSYRFNTFKGQTPQRRGMHGGPGGFHGGPGGPGGPGPRR